MPRLAFRQRLTFVRFLTVLLALSLSVAQDASTISLSNGIRLRITGHRDTNTPDPLTVEMKPASGNSIYRIFHDQSGLAVYAYELVVDRLPDGNHFQIIAKPAGEEFGAKFPSADGGKPTPTMSMQMESPPLGPGGTMTIEIPTNPGYFEHRADVVQVQPNLPGNGAAPLIRFADLRVSIDGKPVPSSGPARTVGGQFAMFYIPKRGGFFFSTQPVPSRAFVQSATVDRTRLKFNLDNQEFDCTAAVPILTQSDRGQIWVYHDRNYKPAGNWTKNNPKAPDQFFTAASDSLNWWLP